MQNSKLWLFLQQVLKMLLESPENPDLELLALCINLATNKRTAQIICGGQVRNFQVFTNHRIVFTKSLNMFCFKITKMKSILIFNCFIFIYNLSVQALLLGIVSDRFVSVYHMSTIHCKGLLTLWEVCESMKKVCYLMSKGYKCFIRFTCFIITSYIL